MCEQCDNNDYWTISIYHVTEEVENQDHLPKLCTDGPHRPENVGFGDGSSALTLFATLAMMLDKDMAVDREKSEDDFAVAYVCEKVPDTSDPNKPDQVKVIRSQVGIIHKMKLDPVTIIDKLLLAEMAEML